MNLFCFSLEGSMDSVYDAAVDGGEGPVYTIPSRHASPPGLLDPSTQWMTSERCSATTNISEINSTTSKKKERRALPKLTSDREALDNTAHVKVARPRVLTPDPVRAPKKADICSKDDRLPQTNSTQTETYSPVQSRNQHQGRPSGRQLETTVALHQDRTDAQGNRTKVNKPGTQGTHPKSKANSKSPSAAVAVRSGPMQALVRESSTCTMRPRGSGTAPSSCQCWTNPREHVLVWTPAHHTCRRPLTVYRSHTLDLSGHGFPGRDDVVYGQTLHRLPSSSQMVHSISNIELYALNRSTSFGKFDAFRHQSSPAQLEENGTATAESESGTEIGDKHSGLGWKMKVISMNMRKRMGKKPGKPCSKDADDHAVVEGETDDCSDQTSNSLENLNTVQSASGGETGSCDVSNNRDSLRSEEDVPHTGQFCGQARVHTDFVPSPYDSDSLKLKVGDIINIISKPPMGIWTGMLHNKVGTFKFIYVDVLVEKEEQEEEDLKIRPQRVSKRPRPKTLLELLERLQLEEYASTLLLNGYQTVEDLKHLKEKHLIELNVMEPEHRRKLLAASEVIYDMSRDDPAETKVDEDEEENDCPRDSGCFILTEATDVGRDDTETQSSTV